MAFITISAANPSLTGICLC